MNTKSLFAFFGALFMVCSLSSCSSDEQGQLNTSSRSTHNHKAGNPVKENITEATCTKSGHYDLVRYCEEDKTEMSRETITTPPLGHDYQKISETQATYSSDGVVTLKCSRCSDITTEKGQPKLSHNYASTYEHNDKYHWQVCIDEGYEDERSPEEEHVFEIEITKPTYEAKGYTTYTCKVCGYSYKDNETDVLTHNYSTRWSSDENKHFHVCIDEGYQDLVEDVGEHEFQTTTIEPSYEHRGYVKHTCAICNYSYNTDYVDKIEHTYSSTWASDGSTHWHPCLDNGYEHLKSNEEQHQFIEWTVAKEATNYEDGEEEATCSICGYHATRIINSALTDSIENKLTFVHPNDRTDVWNVKAKNQNIEGKVVVPSTYQGLPVYATSLSAFNGCSKVTEIEFLNGIERINQSTFEKCTSLKTIIIPPSVNFFYSQSAFHGCSSLETMQIPYISNPDTAQEYQNVVGALFGTTSFNGAIQIEQRYNYPENKKRNYYISPSLKKVTVCHGRIMTGAFSNIDSLEEITLLEGVSSIEKCAFQNCVNLKKADLDASNVSEIEQFAFDNCSSLDTITLPNSLKILFSQVFQNCVALAEIELPDSLEQILTATFKGCSSLSEITIPANVTDLGEFTFSECTSLTTVNWNAVRCERCGITYYDEYHSPFEGIQTPLFVFGEEVELLPPSMFEGNKDITKFVVPDNIKEIGSRAFASSSLEEVVISKNYKLIGTAAFNGCSKLSSVVFEDTEHPVGFLLSMFCHCHSLEHFAFPEGTKSVMDGMFDGCDNLKTVYLPSTVTYIGGFAFRGCSSLETIDTTNVETIGDGAFNGCVSLSSLETGKVKTLKKEALKNCISLTSLDFDNLETIGEGAFAGCSSLQTVDLGSNSIDISDKSFDGCVSLRSVTSGIITNIGDYAFRNTALQEILLKDGLLTIGTYAFAGCSSLKSIVIPNSLTSYGEFFLSGCSSLESLSIPFLYTKLTKYQSNRHEYEDYLLTNVFSATEFEGSVEIQQTPTSYYSYNIVHGYIPASLEELHLTDASKTLSPYSLSNIKTLKRLTILNKPEENSLYCSRNIEYIKFGYFDVELIKIYSSSNTSADGTYMKSLTSISVPGNLPSGLLKNDKYLTSVEVRGTSVAARMFAGATSVTEITFSDDVETLYTGALTDAKLTSFVIPDSVTTIYDGALPSIVTENLDQYCTLYNDCYYLAKGDNPYYALIKAANTSIVDPIIHEDCHIIYSYAFANCLKIKEIVIPENVEHIYHSAFYATLLKKVTIRSNSCEIAALVFSNNHELTTLIVDGGTIKPVEIDVKPFSNYPSPFYYCEKLSTIKLINGATIGDDAYYLFMDTNELYVTEIDYDGTIEDYYANCSFTNKYTSIIVIHCSDGDINLTN